MGFSSNDDLVQYTPLTWQDVTDPVHLAVLKDHEIARRIANWLVDHSLEEAPAIHDDYAEQVKLFGRGRRTPNFKPSSIGSDCLRFIAYEYECKEKPVRDIDPKLQVTFAIGTSIHKHILQPVILAVYGEPCCIIEAPVYVHARKYLGPDTEDPDELLTRGQLDALIIINDPRASLKVGVEIKSINSNQYDKMVSKGPQDYVRMQGACYHVGLGLDYVMFLYLQKNDSILTPTYHAVDEDILNKVRTRISSVRKCVRKGVLPEPTPGMMSCKMCNFKHVCPSPYGRRKGRSVATTMQGGGNG